MTRPFVIGERERSWLEISDEDQFPIQNLPLGRARRADGTTALVSRLGDFAIDLSQLTAEGLIEEQRAIGNGDCSLMSVEGFRALREDLFSLFRAGQSSIRDRPTLLERILIPVDEITMLLPCRIPNFTDFYSGINHASNVGRMFRPDMPPLLPNYLHLPVAYNGRASSVAVSGTSVPRPSGQTKKADASVPDFGPTDELDFEVELGFYVAEHPGPNCKISVKEAGDHILGVCLVNDWSARDIQRWEYQPLGPFLAKSFLTSVSPWIVSLDALEPFKLNREPQRPSPLPHLTENDSSLFDIEITTTLRSRQMSSAQPISQTNAKHLYWSFAQQLAHLTSNGLECLPGELCASGTISGEHPGSYGSLLELSWRGTKPIALDETGESRTFLLDGDTVSISAFASNSDYRIGFGELVGTIERGS